MKNFFLKKKINYIFSSSLFCILFIIGFIIYRDYGIGWDEISDRAFGNYLTKIFVGFFSPSFVEQISNSNIIFENYNRYPNIFFEYTSSFFELLLRKHFNFINTNKDVFEMRHLLIYCFFLLGCFYFLKLNQKIFKNYFISIINLLFLITLPRVFAHSFFNPNDLIHMSFTIINVYYGIKFLDKKNLRNIICLIIISVININCRISAIFIFGLILFFDFVLHFKKKKKIHFHIMIFLITMLMVFLTNPYLLINPVENTLRVLGVLFLHPNTSTTFYLGEYYASNNLPWHYLLVWIAATFPITTQILILSSFFTFLSNYNKGAVIKKTYFIFINCFIFLPIFFGIVFKSSHLDAERYAMFFYPFLIINIGFLFKVIKENKKFFNLFLTTIVIFLLSNIYNLVSFHPYQMIYFNSFFKKDAHLNFDIDYWGVANKDALKFLINYSNKKIIKIYTLSNTPLNNSRWMLDKNQKKRIQIVDDINEADYFFNNFRNYKKKIDINIYKLIYSNEKNGIKINEIYIRQK
jgi:hypothetical protein